MSRPPVPPRQFIEDLCRRHGVSRAFGERMLPLAQRAEHLQPDMRLRLRAFIERSFAAERRREDDEPPPDAAPAVPPREARLVRSVAEALHDWEPPRWLEIWARHLHGRPGPDAAPE